MELKTNLEFAKHSPVNIHCEDGRIELHRSPELG